MNQTIRHWTLYSALAIVAATSLVACGKKDSAPTPTASSAPASTATVPPPPGDSTPKAADSNTRAAAEGNNEKTGSASKQTTVGTAAAGAPPYTLNSAPEGNQAPLQGTKAEDAPKK